ncbi:MAG TPA: hypothetical protein VFD92_06685 [Candidatus Binatia bacterium]|nr:hypothetical protein [Candidatus Binatia bacterium]
MLGGTASLVDFASVFDPSSALGARLFDGASGPLRFALVAAAFVAAGWLLEIALRAPSAPPETRAVPNASGRPRPSDRVATLPPAA